jgi:Fe-S-cluster containining protein
MQECPEVAPYDCQQCGACCVDVFGMVGYVALTVLEAARMERLGLPVVNEGKESFLGTWRHAGPGGDRICAAFAGTVGEGCGCSIYPGRPGKCRQFEVGGINCLAARREAGLPT